MATNPSTTVTNPPDPLAPKMNGNWRRDILGEVREGTFARKDPESYAKYQEYTKQAEDALYQKYYAEEVSNFGKNASTVNARKDAILDARAAANQRFATEISSAGAGTLVSEQVTQPVLPEQPQPPSSATTPVTPASDPQVPGQSRLVNTADDLFGPVDPATDPQVPSGRPPTLPSGRPISTFPGAQPSSRQQVGDVRADGAVLTQFLPNGTPVWVIRPAATPTVVAPATNPQVPAIPPRAFDQSGVVITNQADLAALARLSNELIVRENNLYRARNIRPSNPASVELVNELEESLAQGQLSYNRFLAAAINRARAATPPVDPAANPQVPAAQDFGSDPPIVVPAECQATGHNTGTT
jgi:hypothetical protein